MMTTPMPTSTPVVCVCAGRRHLPAVDAHKKRDKRDGVQALAVKALLSASQSASFCVSVMFTGQAVILQYVPPKMLHPLLYKALLDPLKVHPPPLFPNTTISTQINHTRPDTTYTGRSAALNVMTRAYVFFVVLTVDLGKTPMSCCMVLWCMWLVRMRS